ncbi:hypothetical protein CC1G_14208 [Coprinopsis cinerea okayama7|uniref:Uncharacterized protein n=1 Tax=Coprinopsis cinerea (strain Okayama-7 / 130 / ATCC MYA-4618 / FGSC 9003) TaxID=240176 RepID=D6RLN7_COPC7|nr:hypothetical protein CC1G_14208 [Coprinopsis cinerea okayama7\|eukprot:XP_002911675.1 hypothetical protein CC1G_14208 [Coprinopsis cinerea okayama7\
MDNLSFPTALSVSAGQARVPYPFLSPDEAFALSSRNLVIIATAAANMDLGFRTVSSRGLPATKGSLDNATLHCLFNLEVGNLRAL